LQIAGGAERRRGAERPRTAHHENRRVRLSAIETSDSVTRARKIAAITLTLWKKGENFDVEKLKSQAA
jgi:hypothetical protein